jgi:hypothetical protein
MSKITPKNLHYNTALPPFLARMQAGQAERGGRHEFDVARPRKQRDAGADAEDEPVYFDEETGESLTKGEWEEKERKKEEGENEEEKGDEKEVDKGERTRKENMAVIGGPIKKRKMGKVVGGEEDEGEDEVVKEKKSEKDDKTRKPEKSKSAKKGKKIKLSFGDDE